MNIYSPFIAPVISLLITLAVIPALRLVGHHVGLTDKPSYRKIHKNTVPLVGGVAIFIGSMFSLMMINNAWEDLEKVKMMLTGAFVILLMGLVDDKIDMKASIKLMIQLLLAYLVYASGIRVESAYGILNIYELPEYVQLILTVCVITGVINSFNLLDGIDGLAAGFALFSLTAFSIGAYIIGNIFLLVLFLSLAGALTAFLHFNLSSDKKIFLGDAGSLFLGFMIVVSAIWLLNMARGSENQNWMFILVTSALLVPVIDSLRVFRSRIKAGYSPFRADKTHLHHLMLSLDLAPKYVTTLLIIISILLCIVGLIIGTKVSLTAGIVTAGVTFIIISVILSVLFKVQSWKNKIEGLEHLQQN